MAWNSHTMGEVYIYYVLYSCGIINRLFCIHKDFKHIRKQWLLYTIEDYQSTEKIGLYVVATQLWWNYYLKIFFFYQIQFMFISDILHCQVNISPHGKKGIHTRCLRFKWCCYIRTTIYVRIIRTLLEY